MLSFFLRGYTVLAPVSGHPRTPREAEKVSATAGRLWECVNTEFIRAKVQTGFCQGGRK